MEIKSKLLGPTPDTLRAWSPPHALESHWCVTLGKWANLSGPRLPLL